MGWNNYYKPAAIICSAEGNMFRSEANLDQRAPKLWKEKMYKLFIYLFGPTRCRQVCGFAQFFKFQYSKNLRVRTC